MATKENKDKRNGKQQNNQASDREKRVFLDEQYVKTEENARELKKQEIYKEIPIENIELKEPICNITDYECLNGLSEQKLTKTFEDIKFEISSLV